MMKKIVMYPHGGSGNHGCEAIVRTTSILLSGNDLKLYTENLEEDCRYGLDKVVPIQHSHQNVGKLSISYLKAFWRSHILHDGNAFDELYFSPVISNLDSGNILLSIGGDNYCYGDNRYIYLINKKARKNGCKTVLWGCSVNPEEITDEMYEDLALYDLIIARESITHAALKEINRKTILLPDPAFNLKKQKGFIPSKLEDNTFVGLNLSPMVQKLEKKKGITVENYRLLMEYILAETDWYIALIPHVVKDNNDDRSSLQELYQPFQKTGKVFLIEDQNCMQLKDIISQCKFFVGARTHSTIAAYSSCIPTLTVGYSVKARGIAKDLFGTEENYVLPVQNLGEKDDLLNAFRLLVNKEELIKKHLQKRIPEVKYEANKLSTVLEMLEQGE